MNRLQGNRWQDASALRAVVVTLVAAWLTACGGNSGGPVAGGPVVGNVAAPPAGNVAAPPFENADCLDESGSHVDGLAACGGPGVICTGYFNGTTVHDLAPLTTGGWPSWSPDGLRLAFHRASQGSAQNIYVVNSDGTGERLLTAGRQPSWSADGERIAFMRSDGVAAINADGTGETILFADDTPGGDSTYAPAWSPDGQRIAFVDWPDVDVDDVRFETIYVMNADGSDRRRVTPALGEQFPENYPAWSPSGDRLAFVLRSYGDIMTVDAAGAAPTSVVRFEAEFSRPAWSPDGAKVAYTANHAFVHRYRCRPDAAIRLVGDDGGPTQLIVRNAREPAWSPDGARIALVTVGGGAAYRPPGGDFPPAPEEADVYVREGPYSFGAMTRYLLFDDASFVLQFLLAGSNSIGYSGQYTRNGENLDFQFDGDNRWQATGVLKGDRLTVTYNLIMMLSDFEDGVYVLEGG